MAKHTRPARLAAALLLVLPSALSSQVWEVDEVVPHPGGFVAGAAFGSAIAVGDFNCDGRLDLAQAAPLVDNTGTGADDVGYVALAYGGPGRTFATGLGPSFGAENSRAGSALAAGDFDDDGCSELVIGAPGVDSGEIEESGLVVVVGWDGDSLVLAAILGQDSGSVPGEAEAFDLFGSAFAVGDFNGDGIDDLVIGVSDENVEGAPTELNAGSIVVLYGSESGLTGAGAQEITEDSGALAGAGAQGNARFGFSLAAGNFDGDAYEDLAVGVPDRDVDAGGVKENAGQVVVLYGSAAGLTTTGHERLDDADYLGAIAANDQFGYALASADFDLSLACIVIDCYSDLAIGIPGEPNVALTQTSVGGLVVAYGSSGALATADFDFFQQDNLLDDVSSSETGDRFASVLAAGSLDSRIGVDLAVGVPNENWAGDPAQGIVHLLFGGSAGLLSWPGQALIANAGHSVGPGVDDDRFGAALAAADLDGDFHGDLAIGVPGFDPFGVDDHGAVQVLFGAVFADGMNSGTFGFWSDNEP